MFRIDILYTFGVVNLPTQLGKKSRCSRMEEWRACNVSDPFTNHMTAETTCSWGGAGQGGPSVYSAYAVLTLTINLFSTFV